MQVDCAALSVGNRTFDGGDLIHDHISLSNAAVKLVQEHVTGSSQALSRPCACTPRQRAGVDVVGACPQGARQAAQLLGSCGDAEKAVRVSLRPLGKLCITARVSVLLTHNAGAPLSGTCCRRWPDRLGALQAGCTGHALRPCLWHLDILRRGWRQICRACEG